MVAFSCARQTARVGWCEYSLTLAKTDSSAAAFLGIFSLPDSGCSGPGLLVSAPAAADAAPPPASARAPHSPRACRSPPNAPAAAASHSGCAAWAGRGDGVESELIVRDARLAGEFDARPAVLLTSRSCLEGLEPGEAMT